MKGGARFWDITKESFSEWLNDNVPRLAASLTYYTLFSLAPLLIVIVGIAGLVLGPAAAKGQLQTQLQGQLGGTGAGLIQSILSHASSRGSNIFATVGGFAILFYGASSVFVELHDALNKIWDVPPKPTSGIKGFLASRILPFLMIVGIGLLLLVSFALSWALALAGNFVSGVLPLPSWAFQIFQFIVSTAVITVLFAIIYVMVPDRSIPWSDVWTGAAVTALLFTIGKTLLGVYLGYTSMGSAYGAAASVVVLLFWIYWSAQIFFLGAEFTEVYSRRAGSRKVRRAGGR